MKRCIVSNSYKYLEIRRFEKFRYFVKRFSRLWFASVDCNLKGCAFRNVVNDKQPFVDMCHLHAAEIQFAAVLTSLLFSVFGLVPLLKSVIRDPDIVHGHHETQDDRSYFGISRK